MLRHLTLVFSSIAAAGALSLTAAAQEYSTGNGYCNKRGRDEATKAPVEAFGVHPPGPDQAYSRRCVLWWWKKTYIPYYAPTSPTATSKRWEPCCYFPLMPYCTPYYIGYLPHRLCQSKPAPYGADGGWGDGPMPDHPMPSNPGETPLRYGPYTSVLQDDTIFWNMGGNGLVPYGTPRPPHNGPPDLVDAIQTTRAQGGCVCPPPPGGAPVTAAPVTLPPAEKADGKDGDKENKEAPPQ
jgi:hypothetical protein